MTKRERFLAVLNRQKPDVLPWGGDLDYWIDYLKAENLMEQKYKGEDGVFKLHQDLGVPYYLQGYSPFKTHYEGVEIVKETKGEYQHLEYKTPKGTLKCIEKYVASTYSMAPYEHLIKDYEDLPALRYLYENTYYEPDYELIYKRQQFIGDNGITLCYTPRSPFMELVAQKAGIENLTYIIADAQEEFDETVALMERKHREAAALTIASACECVMIPENLSSEVVGKQYYEKYMLPYHRDLTGDIKKAGKFSFIHMDGSLRGLLKEVSLAGFDVIEALTPAPVGDMTINEIIQTVNNNAIVWGNLPSGFLSDQITDEEFDCYMIETINILKQHNNCVLGVADQVVPLSRIDRIKRVDYLVEKYGRK